MVKKKKNRKKAELSAAASFYLALSTIEAIWEESGRRSMNRSEWVESVILAEIAKSRKQGAENG
jgi:hypothetical protein